ncbi:MAG: spermidine synthase [Bacteroidia bacterium]
MKKINPSPIPFQSKKIESNFSGELEINLLDGKKVLDTATSNYSYGALQETLHIGLEELNLDVRTKSILVLGLGAGSVAETIRQAFHSLAPITLVDIDPAMIRVAKEEFNIHAFDPVELVLEDAFVYVKNSTQEVDLIIVDLFIIDTIPEKFIQDDFLTELVRLLAPNGKLLFNTMRNTMTRAQHKSIQKKLTQTGLAIWVKWQVSGSNDLILGMKV